MMAPILNAQPQGRLGLRVRANMPPPNLTLASAARWDLAAQDPARTSSRPQGRAPIMALSLGNAAHKREASEAGFGVYHILYSR
jgi:hypothetical protein